MAILDAAKLRKIVREASEETIPVGDLGDVRVVDPTIDVVQKITAKLEAKSDSVNHMDSLIDAVRACVPDAESFTDQEIWKLINLAGGHSGPLAKACFKRTWGVDIAAPNPI